MLYNSPSFCQVAATSYRSMATH